MSIDYNRLGVVLNPYQGEKDKILCVCSGGVLRSPTAAWLLSHEPYDFNTRSAGTEDYALIAVDEALLTWADKVVVMEPHHEQKVRNKLKSFGLDKPVQCLRIPDNFMYRAPDLVKLIKERFDAG